MDNACFESLRKQSDNQIVCLAAENINYIRSIVDLPNIEDIVHKRKAKFVLSFSLSCISFADYIIKVCMQCV